MSAGIHIVNRYPHSIEKVWAALTDPTLIPLWTVTGQGAHPEGFEPTVGNRFRYIGRPFPGWDGVVHCEVLKVDAPHQLKYSWRNHPDDEPTFVSYELTETSVGTTFEYDHTGFKGLGGLFMSKLLGLGSPQDARRWTTPCTRRSHRSRDASPRQYASATPDLTRPRSKSDQIRSDQTPARSSDRQPDPDRRMGDASLASQFPNHSPQPADCSYGPTRRRR